MGFGGTPGSLLSPFPAPLSLWRAIHFVTIFIFELFRASYHNPLLKAKNTLNKSLEIHKYLLHSWVNDQTNRTMKVRKCIWLTRVMSCLAFPRYPPTQQMRQSRLGESWDPIRGPGRPRADSGFGSHPQQPQGLFLELQMAQSGGSSFFMVCVNPSCSGDCEG